MRIQAKLSRAGSLNEMKRKAKENRLDEPHKRDITAIRLVQTPGYLVIYRRQPMFSDGVQRKFYTFAMIVSCGKLGVPDRRFLKQFRTAGIFQNLTVKPSSFGRIAQPLRVIGARTNRAKAKNT